VVGVVPSHGSSADRSWGRPLRSSPDWWQRRVRKGIVCIVCRQTGSSRKFAGGLRNAVLLRRRRQTRSADKGECEEGASGIVGLIKGNMT